MPRDTGFIGLQNLPTTFAQLDPIAIERNVAAADHHARSPVGDSMKNEGRSRNLAGILDEAPRIDDGPSASAHDSVGAGPEIAREHDGLSGSNVARVEKVAERAFDVDIRLEVRDVGDQAAQPARAERQCNGNMVEEFGSWNADWHGQDRRQ